MEENQANEILHRISCIGEDMLSDGAEVNRVEDTLARLGYAYGAERMDVFVITSCIIVSMALPNGKELVQMRRIYGSGTNDFTKLEALNELSRSCCAKPLTLTELDERIQSIRNMDSGKFLSYAGAALAAGSFAVFFGGTLYDGLAAAVFALVVCFLQERLSRINLKHVILLFFLSLLSGLLICAFSRAVPFLHMDKIMIGDIMLLIPGIAMTNAIRDMLSGDTLFGMMRLIEALLWALALACGFMSAIWIAGALL